MNLDDFEQELKRRPMPALPPGWREGILKAARSATDGSLQEPRRRAAGWWRELLWPCPQAWAGLAAVWVAIFVLHLTNDSGFSPVQHTTAAPSPEIRAVLLEQQRLFSELLPPSETTAVKPREPADRPRSQAPWQTGFYTAQFSK